MGLITGISIFTDTSSNSGTCTTAQFAGNAINSGIVTETATFEGNAVNSGAIEGTATFSGSAANTDSGSVQGVVVFSGNAVNRGIIQEAVFLDGSVNVGTVQLTATFSGTSRNEGSIEYGVFTESTTVNAGTITQAATLAAGVVNTGTIAVSTVFVQASGAFSYGYFDENGNKIAPPSYQTRAYSVKDIWYKYDASGNALLADGAFNDGSVIRGFRNGLKLQIGSITLGTSSYFYELPLAQVKTLYLDPTLTTRAGSLTGEGIDIDGNTILDEWYITNGELTWINIPKVGAYEDGYFANNILDTTYSNATPQIAKKTTNKWYTYTNGTAVAASGAYTNGYFVNTTLSGTFVTPQSAQDDSSSWYTYTNGVALTAAGAHSNGFYIFGDLIETYTNTLPQTARNLSSTYYVYDNGTPSTASGVYSNGYYSIGTKNQTYTNTTPQSAFDNGLWYSFAGGSITLGSGAYSNGYFFLGQLSRTYTVPQTAKDQPSTWYTYVDGIPTAGSGAFSIGYFVNGSKSSITTPQSAKDQEGVWYVYTASTVTSANGPYTNGYYVNGVQSGTFAEPQAALDNLDLFFTYTNGIATSAEAVAVRTWNQLGADVDPGEAINDYFGYAVALNDAGDRMVIGGYLNNGTAADSGTVKAYELSGSTWVQLGEDVNGEAVSDYFGFDVAINAAGDRFAAGGYLNNGNGTDSGHTRVYQLSNSAWVKMGADIDGEAAGDQAGYSVAMNDEGNIIAIGAVLNDGGGLDSGHVRVYQWNGSAWSQLGSDINGEAADDRFGSEVEINSAGTRIVVGGPLNDGTAGNAGSVRVYELSGSSWVKLGQDLDGEATLDNFGHQVAINAEGNIIAIGAYLNNAAGTDRGHTRVFQISSTALSGMRWIQMGADIDGSVNSDFLGSGLSINNAGTRIAVGAYGNDVLGSAAGMVQIYDWNGTSWTLATSGSTIYGETAGDNAGLQGVSMNGSGNRVAIGAYLNDGLYSNAGHTRVFEYGVANGAYTHGYYVNGIKTGTYTTTPLTALDIRNRGYFYIDGEPTAANGAYSNGYFSSGLQTGTYTTPQTAIDDPTNWYVYNAGVASLSPSRWASYLQTIIPGIETSGQAGYAVDVNETGDWVAVGASFENASVGTDSGAVRVYHQIEGTSTWIQVGDEISGEDAGGRGGYSVAINASGNVVVLGSVTSNILGTNSQGHATAYRLTYALSGLSWVQMGQRIDGPAEAGQLGHCIEINSTGTRMAVGAPTVDSNGVDAGLVEVYDFNGSTWVQVGQDIIGEGAGDLMGAYSIGMNYSGSRIIVGSINNDGGASNAGSARVYELSGSTWVKIGQDIDDTVAGSQFGFTVGMDDSGDIIVVGGRYYDVTTGVDTNEGVARVYQLSSTALSGLRWVQKGSNIIGEVAGDQAGFVAINGDGTRVAAGNYYYDLYDGNYGLTFADVGVVRPYEWNGTSWSKMTVFGSAYGTDLIPTMPYTGLSQQASILLAGGPESMQFNKTGNVLVVGGYGADVNGIVDAGSVYIYEYSNQGPRPAAANGPYTWGYLNAGVLSGTFVTPQTALNHSGGWYVYTNGIPASANKAYTNGYFVNGVLSGTFTTPLPAADNLAQWYTYQDGVPTLWTGTTFANTTVTTPIPSGSMVLLDAALYVPKDTNTWRDLSRNGRNATLVGSPTFDMLSGGRVVFNGSTHYGTLPSGFANFTNGITIMAFVNFGTVNHWERIIDFGGGATSNNILFGRNYNTSNTTFQIYNGIGGAVTTNLGMGTIATNAFAFYLVRLTSSNYRQSIQTSTQYYVASANTAVTLPSNVTRTINYIGASNWGDPLFGGDFGVISVYDRGIRDGEIKQFYNHYASRYGLPTWSDTRYGIYSDGYLENGCLYNLGTSVLPITAIDNGLYYTYLSGVATIANKVYTTGYFVSGVSTNSNTPLSASNQTGGWYTYTNSVPSSANGPYSNGYFVNGVLSGTFVVPQSAQNQTGGWYTYTSGTAASANGAYTNGYFVSGSSTTIMTPQSARNQTGGWYVYGTPSVPTSANGPYSNGYFVNGVLSGTFVNPQSAQNQTGGWYSYTSGTAASANGTFIEGYFTNGTYTGATLSAQYLIVAGGGGGGYGLGGGGGAGGVLNETVFLARKSYWVLVGAGGAGSTATGVNGTNGGNSVLSAIATTNITSITAYGGGGGGTNANNASNGGSGGGAMGTGTGGARSPGKGVYPGSTYLSAVRQGYDGGAGRFIDGGGAAGGGGGAGGAGVGSPANNTAGAGGPGLTVSITGSAVTYGGGGGGGGSPTNGAGGTGGGGAGTTTTGISGTPNTGGGGGGGGTVGGKGGSGFFALRYLGPQVATGGTVTSLDGYTIHTFTTSQILSVSI